MKMYEELLKENFTKPKKITKTRIVGCGVIGRVIKNNVVQVLLVQRASDDHYPNFWELPRGGCQVKDKNSKNCTIREIREETGLDVKIVAILGEYSYYKKKTEESICKIYLCKMIDETQPVKLSHEHKDSRWISTYAEAQLLLNPDQLKYVHAVFNNSDFEMVTQPSFELSNVENQWE